MNALIETLSSRKGQLLETLIEHIQLSYCAFNCSSNRSSVRYITDKD